MTDVPPPPWRPSRRQLLVGLAITLALAVLAAPVVVWWVGHRATLDVVALTGVPDCEGTEPVVADDFEETGFRRTAIPMRRGFACTLSVKVINRSDHDIDLGRFVFPLGGHRAGFNFKATFVNGQKPSRADAPDAVVAIDQTLVPGEKLVIPLHVEYRKSGCTSAGAAAWVDPVLQVQDTIASHDLVIADLPAFQGTADSSCDE